MALIIGEKCSSGRHVILASDDIYVEPSTGSRRCRRCFTANRSRARNRQRKFVMIEPDIEVVPRSMVPPPFAARVEPGTWEALARRASLLARSEALKISGVGIGTEHPVREALRKANLNHSVVFRAGSLWVYRQDEGKS